MDPRILDDAVARGIITPEQRQAILALTPPARRAEGEPGLNGISVAYGIGALLVLFASGWFLVSRWATLGPWGVLAVTAGYAAIFVWSARRLRTLGYPRAADLVQVLAIGLTPLVAWSLMRLAGEWPPEAELPGLMTSAWMRTRFLVLDLSTILVALIAWRTRRFPALMLPLAVAMWWAWIHGSQLLEVRPSNEWYERWIMLAAGLSILALADSVERWQRREALVGAEGDYAMSLWLVGTLAFAFAFLVTWVRLEAGKHILLPVAFGLLALFVRTRRRALLVAGGAGVVGYLAWLASEVFKDTALFPIALVGLGLAVIAGTVWVQRRFPSLRSGAHGSGGVLPWPAAVSWAPAIATLALGVVALATSDGDADQRLFREQWERQRLESHRPRAADSTVRKP